MRVWPAMAALLLLAACEDETTSATATASAPPHPRIPIQQFLPPPPPPAASPAPATAEANGGGTAESSLPERQNDPSAPLDTPLCGRAQRETVAMDAAILPASGAEGGACAATACFDPLTATYIGADGDRHVCQE